MGDPTIANLVFRAAPMAMAATCCAALAACGGSTVDRRDAPDTRRPAPAPRIVLTRAERVQWAHRRPDRSAVPVLRYHDVEREAFARQMTLLDHAGHETITLPEFVRFRRGEQVDLPPRPLLLTFDGGRADDWIASDSILRALGFEAVVFVDVGRVDKRRRDHLTWTELNAMQRSGRWDVQLQSGDGSREVRWGPGPRDVGPVYAYRGADERIDGWREGVFSDITWAEEQLAFRVEDYRPLAFAPPYGNYGQAGTNDPRIPRLLLARLLDSFELVFTQDRSGLARPRPDKPNPVGRFDIAPHVDDGELHALLRLDRQEPLR